MERKSVNLLELIDENGKRVVVFEGKRLPLYELSGRYYFLDSIPVEYLELDEEAQPRKYDDGQARKIADSIKRKVLMQPLLTRYDQERELFLITEGQHRWHAMRDMLDQSRIPCIVYVQMDKHIALLCGLEANAEDRARALSGGDIARKTHALMHEHRLLLEKEGDVGEITETEVLKKMGRTTKSNQKKFLLGKLVEDVRETPNAKIAKYISDRQSRSHPLTARNFGYFLQHLVKTTALDSKDEEHLRDEELANVIRVTDIVAETLFEGAKWDPQNPDSHSHQHAVNVCRRHPFEACGYFIGKVIERRGGNEISVGPCFEETNKIDWDKAATDITKMLLDGIWDQAHISQCRSIEELKEHLSKEWKKP